MERLAPALVAAIAVMIIFWAGAGVMTAPTAYGPGYGDEAMFHHPVVVQFMQQWPTPNFSDYSATSTPLYYMMLAGVGKALGGDIVHLRFAGMLFSMALIAMIAYWIAKRCGSMMGLLLVLPMAVSMNFFPRAFTVNPDNAAWMFVGFMLLLSLRGKVDKWFFILSAIGCLLTVLCRQSHLWVCSLVWTAAWFGTLRDARQVHAEESRSIVGWLLWTLTPTRERLTRAALGFVATIPAFAAILGFWMLWGGPVPPSMQTTVDNPISSTVAAHQVAVLGTNGAMPALVIALVGAFGMFLLGYLAPAIRQVISGDRRSIVVLACSIAAGLLIAGVPHTTMDQASQRIGDLWMLAGIGPTIGERSLVIIALGGVGGAVLGLLGLMLDRRTLMVAVAALLAITVAHMANANPWQRYVGPFVLMSLAVFTALAVRQWHLRAAAGDERMALAACRRPSVRMAHAGCLALVLVLATCTSLKFVPPTERWSLVDSVVRSLGFVLGSWGLL